MSTLPLILLVKEVEDIPEEERNMRRILKSKKSL